MRSSTKLGALVVAAATTAGLLAAPAGAADPVHPVVYLGVAGGSKVVALDGTVTSGLTAQSGIEGFTLPNSASNNVAGAHMGPIVSTGAITTSENATQQGTGAELVSHSKTLGLDLLNGVITADVAETTGTADFDGSSTLTASTHTT